LALGAIDLPQALLTGRRSPGGSAPTISPNPDDEALAAPLDGMVRRC